MITSHTHSLRASILASGSVASPAVLTITPPFPTGTTLIPYTTPTTAVAVGATATVTNITLLGAATVRAGVLRAK